MSEYGTCRSCGARIRWVITSKGHRMPLDPNPHPQGNVVPQGQSITVLEPLAVVLPEPPTDRPAWRSHFATCPNAAKHRKTKERRDGR